MCMLGIELAGIRVAVQFADADLEARVRNRYAAFLAPAEGAVCLVRAAVKDGVGVPPRADDIWRVETEMRGEHLSYRSLYDEGWMDWRRAEGGITVRPQADIENYLRVMYGFLTARSGGIMLHASAVARDGHAFVFVGPSGSGKSTVAHLSLDAGMTILGDDIVLITRRDGGFLAHGVPFRGSNPRAPQINVSAPLGGVYTLVKSESHGMRPLDHAAAVARLVQCVPFVMGDIDICTTVIGTCRDIVQYAAVGSLNFRKDAGFWSVINEPIGPISHTA